jgi:broad specificity phosphatase PhoE
LINPLKPSWGEAFLSVEARMLEALTAAWAVADGGEIVMVSHQMPIVMVARSVKKMRLAHDPRRRRCTLSSITTLAREGDLFVEVDYQEPAGELLAVSTDLGAV